MRNSEFFFQANFNSPQIGVTFCLCGAFKLLFFLHFSPLAFGEKVGGDLPLKMALLCLSNHLKWENGGQCRPEGLILFFLVHCRTV